MSDADDIKDLLSAVGRIEGKLEAIPRIETRLNAMDDSMVQATGDTHERITRHRKDGEQRLDSRLATERAECAERMSKAKTEMESRLVETATRLSSQTAQVALDLGEVQKTVRLNTLVLAGAGASWKTICFIGGSAVTIAGLFIAIMEYVRR